MSNNENNNNTDKTTLDVTLRDVGSSISKGVKEFDGKQAWKSTCRGSKKAMDATCGAINDTSMREIGNGCARGWAAVASLFNTDDK